MATKDQCDFLYHRARVYIPQAIELVMLVGKANQCLTTMVSIKQAYDVLVAGTCNHQYFHRKVQSGISSSSMSTLKGEDMNVMKRLEACPNGLCPPCSEA